MTTATLAIAKLLLLVNMFMPGAIPQGFIYSGSATPWTLNAHAKSDLGSGAVGSITCTVNISHANDAIPLFVYINETSPGTVSISDTQGNSFGSVLDNVSGILGSSWVGDYFAKSGSTGSDAITIAWSGSTVGYNAAFCADYTPGTGIPSVDDHEHGSLSSGGSTSPASTNLTTTTANDLLVSAFFMGGPTTFTPGSGYTTIDTSTNVTGDWQSQTAGVSGSYAANGTLSTAQNWVVTSIAIK